MKLYVMSFLSAVLLSGCANQGGGITKQQGGTVIGGATGALIGSQFGKGSGRIVGAGLGGVLGALAGSEVGKSMDQQDEANRRHYRDDRYYDDYDRPSRKRVYYYED
ncbi:MAG: glycine zipper 2TM domain-containing protein [Candidatus Paracaedibacteraceae bacterium]|nr:glycine zipper 2TM domain-containing protein [Candidatus Paracaedibacteraceae bacterium]